MMNKFLLFAILSFLWSNSVFAQIVGGVPKAERDALLDLYDATDGPNWANKANWNTPADVNEWYGVTVEQGHVTELDFYNNQLSVSIPSELGELTSLETLILSSNQLSGSIPPELGDLNNLTRLHLTYNQLSGSIPSELGELNNLTRLYLSSNQLSGVVGDLNMTSLIYSVDVDVRNNRLTFADLEKILSDNLSYSPQAFVSITRIINENNIIFSIPESVGGEEYQWYKDGVKLSLETDRELTVSEIEKGVYYCEITHSEYPDLTLRSREGVVDSYSLRYSAGTNGSINGETSQIVNYGENGSEVEAIPDENYHFVKWSDGLSTAMRIDIYVTRNIEVEAEFAINTYTVTFSVTGSDNIPIDNAVVNINSIEISTDDEGKAQVDLPNGKYAYMVSKSGEVIEASNVTIHDENVTVHISAPSTGIYEESSSSTTISPNPFTDHLTINDALDVVRVEITNLTGKTLFNQNYTGQNEIVIKSSSFKEGVYLISVYTADGKRIVDKVVKRK